MNIDLNKQYLDTGVIFVPGLWEAERVDRMRVISEHCLAQWRMKNETASEAVVMRHLNDPAYFKTQRQWLVDLLEAVADPRVLEVVGEVFNDEVLFRCTSLFMNPLEKGGDGNWHRDCQFSSKTEDQERERFDAEVKRIKEKKKVNSMQMQIALMPSDDSQYVPCSHLVWDTPDQRFIRLGDDQKHNRSSLMPGAVTTHQEPGDAAAFHPNGLHRGRYHCDKCRRTVMLTYTSMSGSHPEDGFSNQPWFLEPGYLDGLSDHAKAFYQRFIDIYSDFWKRSAASS